MKNKYEPLKLTRMTFKQWITAADDAAVKRGYAPGLLEFIGLEVCIELHKSGVAPVEVPDKIFATYEDCSDIIDDMAFV